MLSFAGSEAAAEKLFFIDSAWDADEMKRIGSPGTRNPILLNCFAVNMTGQSVRNRSLDDRLNKLRLEFALVDIGKDHTVAERALAERIVRYLHIARVIDAVCPECGF